MSLILESPTCVKWNLPSCADCKNSYGSAMYFDVTREELLNLISAYEAENSLRSLSTKAGISYAALVDFKRGKSSMLGDKNLRAVMSILRPQENLIPTIPVVGYVGAGAVVEMADSNYAQGDGMYHVDCPRNIDSERGVALEVKGDSMEPLLSEGFLLFYNERHPGVPAEFIGKICVLWLDNDGIMVKRVKRGSLVGRYDLVSINDAHDTIKDAKVIFSSFVATIEQRMI